MDPDKIKAIENWEAPTSVKGFRGLLGFANFYRRFIHRFADIARPLVELTRKDRVFQWNPEADEAFRKLKNIFITAPALSQFDYDRPTRIETDSSGWCTGGTLQQKSDNGLWVPCAFFSKKNNSAECNYEIYDKEMLAIIRCLEEWDAELRGLQQFDICTDHKNLEYFMTVRKLTERQMRWSLILSRYNFRIIHVPGKYNERADGLFRRDQDMPNNLDERLLDRRICLLKPQVLVSTNYIQSPPIDPSCIHDCENSIIGSEMIELDVWDSAISEDSQYTRPLEAVKLGKDRFPTDLHLKVSISECSESKSGGLLFRGRRWVPNGRNLKTKIIQSIHDSPLNGHPGVRVLK